MIYNSWALRISTSDTLIHVYGTSHVSKESLELIEEKLEEHDPDIVALELDLLRLNALLSGEETSEGPLFLKLVKRFQKSVGSRTGVMPGDEMIYAYRKALAEGREVALIDQDIRITVERLKQVSRKEKVRAVLEAVGGLLMPGKFDVQSIPEEELIGQLLDELKVRFPQLHRVLVEERNKVMADYLGNLEENNPDSEIVAFVGAGHKQELERLLDPQTLG